MDHLIRMLLQKLSQSEKKANLPSDDPAFNMQLPYSAAHAADFIAVYAVSGLFRGEKIKLDLIPVHMRINIEKK